MQIVPYNPAQPPAQALGYGQVAQGQSSLADGMSGESLNKITLKPDRTFSLSVNGQEIQRMPSPVQVVIQDFNPGVSRSYYSTAYDPSAKATAPDCYSADGVMPALNAKNRQHSQCDACPMNVKGERGKPCRTFKRLVVTLVGDTEPGRLFQLDSSATSTFGDEYPHENKLNLKGFAAKMAESGLNQNIMVVNLHSDMNVDYQKMLFEPVGFIPEADYNAMLSTLDPAGLAKYVKVEYGSAAQPAQPDSASAVGQSPNPPVATAPAPTQPATTAAQPVTQPSTAPVTQPAPVAQPVTGAVPQTQDPAAVAQPAQPAAVQQPAPVTQPAAVQPVAQPVAQPAVVGTGTSEAQDPAVVQQPAAQPVAQPVTQPAATPESQPVAAQPVAAQPVAQPAPVTQPVAAVPASEQVVDQAPATDVASHPAVVGAQQLMENMT